MSELARRFGLNRETVRERLKRNGVEPKSQTAREKRYDVAEATRALRPKGAEGLREAQTEKTAAEAERAKLKLERERGEVVSMQDVREGLQKLIKQIYQHFAVTSPATLAPQLRGKSVAQMEATLKRDAERFFTALRTEHESYL